MISNEMDRRVAHGATSCVTCLNGHRSGSGERLRETAVWRPRGLAWLSLLLALVVLVNGMGCSGPRAHGAREQPMTADVLEHLRGVTFTLVRFDFEGKRQILPRDAELNLSFGDQQKVNGYGGVNRFFGSYALKEGGDIRWRGSGFGATRRAGPPEHMQVEQAFLKSLHRTTRMTYIGTNLILSNEDPAIRLEFAAPKK